jgi:hypothetical protein
MFSKSTKLKALIALIVVVGIHKQINFRHLVGQDDKYIIPALFASIVISIVWAFVFNIVNKITEAKRNYINVVGLTKKDSTPEVFLSVITEEVTFSLLAVILFQLTGHWWILIIFSIAFGFLHKEKQLYQSINYIFRGAFMITILFYGGLASAILGHVIYNVLMEGLQ